VARERLGLPCPTDSWINALDGSPSSWSIKEVAPGLLATLRRDLVPWLETNAPVSLELQPRLPDDPHPPRCTWVLEPRGLPPGIL
jgi:hypothetical protein